MSIYENVSTAYFDNLLYICYTIKYALGGVSMKRILIFSDTHGYIDNCINIIGSDERVNMIIHAGDCVRDAEDLASVFPNIPVYYVRGNNDWYSKAPGDVTLETGGKKIFITHGHDYSVKYEADYRTLAKRGSEIGADLVVFGHTHTPYTGYIGKMTVLNPGSVRFTGTYAAAEIDGSELRTKIFEI